MYNDVKEVKNKYGREKGKEFLSFLHTLIVEKKNNEEGLPAFVTSLINYLMHEKGEEYITQLHDFVYSCLTASEKSSSLLSELDEHSRRYYLTKIRKEFAKIDAVSQPSLTKTRYTLQLLFAVKWPGEWKVKEAIAIGGVETIPHAEDKRDYYSFEYLCEDDYHFFYRFHLHIILLIDKANHKMFYFGNHGGYCFLYKGYLVVTSRRVIGNKHPVTFINKITGSEKDVVDMFDAPELNEKRRLISYDYINSMEVDREGALQINVGRCYVDGNGYAGAEEKEKRLEDLYCWKLKVQGGKITGDKEVFASPRRKISLDNMKEICRRCNVEKTKFTPTGMDITLVSCEMVFEGGGEQLHLFMQNMYQNGEGVLFIVQTIPAGLVNIDNDDNIKLLKHPSAKKIDEYFDFQDPNKYDGQFVEQYKIMLDMIMEKRKEYNLFISEEERNRKYWDELEMMEPVEISNEELFSHGKYIAESHDYLFYSYHSDENKAWGTYLVRVTKRNPTEMVFFGEQEDWNCIFHEYLFSIDKRSGFFSDLSLRQVDVDSGEESALDLFGKGRVFEAFGRDSVHEICQDKIQNMYVKDDVLVLEVSRKEGSVRPGVIEKYNKDLEYRIEISFDNTELKVDKIFPEIPDSDNEISEEILNNKQYDDEAIELSEKYQLVQAAVACIITEREEAGHPAGANYQIAYFIMFANILKEIAVFSERDCIMVMNIYRLNVEQQLSSEGLDAIRIIENAYMKIRQETDQAHTVERFAYYIEQIFCEKEELTDDIVADRILIVISNVRDTLSALVGDNNQETPFSRDSDILDTDIQRNASESFGNRPSNEINRQGIVSDDDIYALLRRNVNKYSKDPNHPSAQEILASMVITYALIGFKDEYESIEESSVINCETIIFTTFYVICHILDQTVDKALQTSELNPFFNIVVKEVEQNASSISPETRSHFWNDRWSYYYSMMDQTGDMDKYLTKATDAFSAFIKYDKTHYNNYCDNWISSETVVSNIELQGIFESLQEQIKIDSYIYSLDNVFEDVVQQVVDSFTD